MQAVRYHIYEDTAIAGEREASWSAESGVAFGEFFKGGEPMTRVSKYVTFATTEHLMDSKTFRSSEEAHGFVAVESGQ